MLILILILNSILFASALNNETFFLDKSAAEFVFTTPDVVKEYLRDDGTRVRLNAYKTSNNDQLLSEQKYSALKWVSLGQPQLVRFNDQNLFQLNVPTTFSLYFEMLTNRDREVLANEVKESRGFTVRSEQFFDIDSKSIECSIELYDSKEKKSVFLKGKVFNSNIAPYKVDFKYTIGSKDRLLFEQTVNQNSNDFEFQCTITSGTLRQKSNTFTISVQESNNIKLSDKLFGPANESYVTRDQLTELSNEVNSYFSVVESYQIPEDQFSSAFVENLISLAGQTTFTPVSFNEALKSLSKYSLDISGDLNPNQITKEMSEIFKIEKVGEKSHIIFDEKYYKDLEQQSAASGNSTVVTSGFFGIGGGTQTSHYAQSKYDYWLDKGTSLADQLNELNAYSENKIKYEFEGNKIVPKTIQVSKLQSSAFKKTLSFTRIKNFYFEDDFIKSFSLNKNKFLTKKYSKYPNYLIAMLGSEDQLKFFDQNGKGFDEMTGWYLCDGRNGSPDLRGRVAVGTHPTLYDGNYKIGHFGGNDQLQLTVDQMPSHSHSGLFSF
jgi:hypothetical protein